MTSTRPDPLARPTAGLAGRRRGRWVPRPPGRARSDHLGADGGEVRQTLRARLRHPGARHPATRKMCISTSRSASPLGGFVDRRRTPLICPKARGAIDPAFFTGVTGGRYLLWKREQRPGPQPRVHQPALGRRPAGDRHPHAPVDHQGHLGVAVDREPGDGPRTPRYYLFYSGGSYADDSYATGYAVCRTATGPCTRARRPLLATGGRVVRPGRRDAVRRPQPPAAAGVRRMGPRQHRLPEVARVPTHAPPVARSASCTSRPSG